MPSDGKIELVEFVVDHDSEVILYKLYRHLVTAIMLPSKILQL